MRVTLLVLATALEKSFRSLYKAFPVARCAGTSRLQLGHTAADSMLTFAAPLPVASRGLRNVCIWHRTTLSVPTVRHCVPTVHASATQQQQHSTNISSMRALHVAGDDATDQQQANEEVKIASEVSSLPDAWSSFLEALFLRGFFETNSGGKDREAALSNRRDIKKALQELGRKRADIILQLSPELVKDLAHQDYKEQQTRKSKISIQRLLSSTTADNVSSDTQDSKRASTQDFLLAMWCLADSLAESIKPTDDALGILSRCAAAVLELEASPADPKLIALAIGATATPDSTSYNQHQSVLHKRREEAVNAIRDRAQIGKSGVGRFPVSDNSMVKHKMRLLKSAPYVNMKAGDWFCGACGSHNYARNKACYRCEVPSSSIGSSTVSASEVRQLRHIGLQEVSPQDLDKAKAFAVEVAHALPSAAAANAAANLADVVKAAGLRAFQPTAARELSGWSLLGDDNSSSSSSSWEHRADRTHKDRDNQRGHRTQQWESSSSSSSSRPWDSSRSNPDSFTSSSSKRGGSAADSSPAANAGLAEALREALGGLQTELTATQQAAFQPRGSKEPRQPHGPHVLVGEGDWDSAGEQDQGRSAAEQRVRPGVRRVGQRESKQPQGQSADGADAFQAYSRGSIRTSTRGPVRSQARTSGWGRDRAHDEDDLSGWAEEYGDGLSSRRRQDAGTRDGDSSKQSLFNTDRSRDGRRDSGQWSQGRPERVRRDSFDRQDGYDSEGGYGMGRRSGERDASASDGMEGSGRDDAGWERREWRGLDRQGRRGGRSDDRGRGAGRGAGRGSGSRREHRRGSASDGRDKKPSWKAIFD